MTNSWSLLYDELYDMNLTDEEVEELRSKKQELTQYGKEKIRELTDFIDFVRFKLGIDDYDGIDVDEVLK